MTDEEITAALAEELIHVNLADFLADMATTLLPIVRRIAEQRAAEAMTQTANVWQYSVWTDMPRVGRVRDRIEAAQFVTDWLRARANGLGSSSPNTPATRSARDLLEEMAGPVSRARQQARLLGDES